MVDAVIAATAISYMLVPALSLTRAAASTTTVAKPGSAVPDDDASRYQRLVLMVS